MQTHLLLERWIIQLNEDVSRALSRWNRKVFFLSASALLIGVQYLFFLERFPFNRYNQFIFPPLFARILIVCPLFALLPILSRPFKLCAEGLSLLLFVVSPSLFHVGTGPHFPWVAIATVLAFYLIVGLNSALAQMRVWYPIGSGFATAVFVAIVNFSIRVSGLTMDVYQIFLPPTERLGMLAYPFRKSETLKRFLLSPVHLLYPVPLFEEPQPDSAPVRAVMDVFIALAHFASGVFWGYLLSLVRPMTIVNHWITLLVAGWINYFYYYANSVGLIIIATALLKLSGFNLIEGAHLPLLASNPADRWRRWNIPFYNWFFLNTYLPSFRKYRSHFLAVMWTFFITWFFHRWSEVVYGGIRYFSVRAIDAEIWHQYFLSKQMFVFFMLHGLVVYIAIRFPKLFPPTLTGVVLTQLLMAIVHVAVL